MAARARLIGPAQALEEAGRGLRFEVERGGETVPAFPVRWGGRVHAYLNRCAHLPVELDFNPGDFFDASRLYLICSTHGALYAPDTGVCMGGRCSGRGLIPLEVFERDGGIYLCEGIDFDG